MKGWICWVRGQVDPETICVLADTREAARYTACRRLDCGYTEVIARRDRKFETMALGWESPEALGHGPR